MAKLSDTAFVILLSLGQSQGQRLHGYALLQHAKTHNGHVLGAGALYPQLTRLVQQGLIEEVQGSIQQEDPRRRYYQLTRQGLAACKVQATMRSTLARRILEWQEAHV